MPSEGRGILSPVRLPVPPLQQLREPTLFRLSYRKAHCRLYCRVSLYPLQFCRGPLLMHEPHQLQACIGEVRAANDLVAAVNRFRFVAEDCHSRGTWNPCPSHIPHCTPSKIVEEETLQPCPFARLMPSIQVGTDGPLYKPGFVRTRNDRRGQSPLSA
jgi:hypothetical protein